MTRRFNLVQNLTKMFKNAILNLADNTIRFHWTHKQWLAYRQEHIFMHNDYKKLPRWAREYLNGYDDALFEHVWQRKVVFSYVIDEKGTRASIESVAYRAVSPMVISECYSRTGCYVWRDNPEKFWTQPDSGIKK